MRLELSPADKKRIGRLVEETDEFNNQEHVIRRALHEFLNQRESEFLISEVPPGGRFEWQKMRRPEGHPVTLSFQPKRNSNVRFKYHQRGDPPHTALLETDKTVIGADEIERVITEVTGVAECNVPNTTGDFRVTIADNLNQPLDDVIKSIREKINELIEERERRIRDGEETRGDAHERALSGYWN